MNSVAPPEVFDLLEDLVDEQELETILQRPYEELRDELVAKGADLERVRVTIEHALGLGPAPLPRRPPAKVIPLSAKRPSRAIPILRSISVAVAASFFGLFVWRQGTMRVGTDRPSRPDLSQTVPPPVPTVLAETDEQRATRMRAQAYALCERGYWGECQDMLDAAGRLDRPGNETLEVNEARNRIGIEKDDDVNGSTPAFAKPSVGPGEVPLRRRQH